MISSKRKLVSNKSNQKEGIPDVISFLVVDEKKSLRHEDMVKEHVQTPTSSDIFKKDDRDVLMDQEKYNLLMEIYRFDADQSKPNSSEAVSHFMAITGSTNESQARAYLQRSGHRLRNAVREYIYQDSHA